MTDVLTLESLRRAVNTMKADYQAFSADDSYVVYMRQAAFLMLRRNRSWWQITDRRSEMKMERRRVRRPSRLLTGGRVRRL